MTRISPYESDEESNFAVGKDYKSKMGFNSSECSGSSASQTLMSSHTMKMGFYRIDLGTKKGQKLHALHMLILPLIPVVILLAQNISNLISFSRSANEVVNVEKQVTQALELSSLVQRLQEERAAVALNIFIGGEFDDIDKLKNFTNIDISEFTLVGTFNKTDTVLQNIQTWPKINWVDYFKTKLKFQIQHSIFRTKIRGGETTIFEVISWYNKITTFILNYISYSIHDSDVSDFYRYIISFKNILRSLEYAYKTGIYGLRYLTNGDLTREQYHILIKNEMLRNEYLNQTFNFLPDLKVEYEESVKNTYLEEVQKRVLEKDIDNPANLTYIVKYFSHQMSYTLKTRKIITTLSDIIARFVKNEFQKYTSKKTLPLVLIIVLILFIPVVAYVTLQASTSMFKYSTLYNKKVGIYRQEKLRNEKLLTDLLPLQIVLEMKKGRIPKPVIFNSVTIFLCDIVGFTSLASESTAHQIIEFLNALYNLFDERIEEYDVYKVETIGDAYMVASGIPEENETHAVEIARASLDILAKVVTFETQHKPGYRLRVRIGIHSGECVGGVVGTKIPRYSVFGNTVDITGQLEALSKPMKIQISESTKLLLDKEGTFTCQVRGSPVHLKGFQPMTTYWLIGRKCEKSNDQLLNIQSSLEPSAITRK